MSRRRRFRWIGIGIGVGACGIGSSGCGGVEVVLVPVGEPVMLGESVRALVYVQIEGEMVLSRNRVTIPEGWWALPDPEK